jgi:hypothetical protein
MQELKVHGVMLELMEPLEPQAAQGQWEVRDSLEPLVPLVSRVQ